MRKLLFFLLLMPAMLLAQAVIPLTDGDFPDAIVGKADNYDIASVMEYNSAADMMIEFGFSSLMVQEIVWETARIKVEVYQMSSPEAAFGVYSLSVLKCVQRDTLTAYDCNAVYQYQAAYGNLFIIVSSENGSGFARAHYLPAANAVMKKNPQRTLDLPEPFNMPLMKKGQKNLVYTRGLISLQNSLFPWQELFLGVNFGMYAIVLANAESDLYFARIRFDTPEGKLRFLSLAGLTMGDVPVPNTNTNDGLYREYQQVKPEDPLTIYFLQSQEPWPINAVISGAK
jgi:hypothetical protein